MWDLFNSYNSNENSLEQNSPKAPKTKVSKATKLNTNNLSGSPVNRNMYDEDTTFVFYSKSSPAKPGKGKNEKIPDEKVDMYKELAAIPDWRKKLSNFWIQPFKLDGREWASVEHYYQGSKFKNSNPNFYEEFSLDSGSKLSKDPVLAKAMGGKDVKHKYRSKEITVDEDFFQGRAEIEMNSAQHAKFGQHPDLKAMLKATKRAKLAHYTRGGKMETFHNLMKLRVFYS